jgi:hypothetical protein
VAYSVRLRQVKVVSRSTWCHQNGAVSWPPGRLQAASLIASRSGRVVPGGKRDDNLCVETSTANCNRYCYSSHNRSSRLDWCAENEPFYLNFGNRKSKYEYIFNNFLFVRRSWWLAFDVSAAPECHRLSGHWKPEPPEETYAVRESRPLYDTRNRYDRETNPRPQRRDRRWC